MTENIKVLTGLDHIRLRYGMYITDASTPETLFKEFRDNSIDELLNNYADRVEIDFDYKEGWFRVRDNGRGLPLTKYKSNDPNQEKIQGTVSARLLFTEMYSGGKFDHTNYEYSTGTNGLGMTICNALSSKLIVRVADKKNVCKGNIYRLELAEGNIVSEEFINPKKFKDEDWWFSTEMTCWPDMSIFRSMNAKVNEIQLELAKSARPEVTIRINGRDVQPFSFSETVEVNLLNEKVFKVFCSYGSVKYEIQFGWSAKEFNNFYRGAVNLGPCNEGFHIREVRGAIGKSLSTFSEALINSDADYGLRLFVNAFVSDPDYSSQTKEKLSWIKDFARFNESLMRQKYSHLIQIDENGKELLSAAKEAVKQDPKYQDPSNLSEIICKEVKNALSSDEEFMNVLITRLIEYKKSVELLSDQSYINSLIKTGGDKLSRSSVRGVVEATSPNRKECEIYLCEGRSAGSPIKEGRDKNTQALFELRGKPKNVALAEDIKEIIDNVEIRTIINAIGIGLTPNTKIEDARYGKIIIATDADFDGLHIQGLILGALCFLIPEVFSGGPNGESMVYIAQAPLYKQNDKFYYDEKALNPNKPFKRFKGLGSMLPKDLKTTVVDKKNRKLVKVSLQEGRDRVLDIVTNTAQKKRIMVENGLLIEDL